MAINLSFLVRVSGARDPGPDGGAGDEAFDALTVDAAIRRAGLEHDRDLSLFLDGPADFEIASAEAPHFIEDARFISL